MTIRVVHRVSKARGVVVNSSFVERWRLLVLLDLDSPRHTSLMEVSTAPGQLVAWTLDEVDVEAPQIPG